MVSTDGGWVFPSQGCLSLRCTQIPSSGALSKLCSPTCSCLQAGGTQTRGRAISQVLDVLFGLENRHTSLLLLLAFIELTLVSAFLSLPRCEDLLMCI